MGWPFCCLSALCMTDYVLLLLVLQVLVSEGGVGYLVHGLVHPDLEVSCCCSEMLARLASTHQQQPLDAIRSVARRVLNIRAAQLTTHADCGLVPPKVLSMSVNIVALHTSSCAHSCLFSFCCATSGADGHCVCPAGLLVVYLHQLSCWPVHPRPSSSCTCCPSSQRWRAAVRGRARSWHRQEHPQYCCRWWRPSHCHKHRYGTHRACQQSCAYQYCTAQQLISLCACCQAGTISLRV
jgi:hypothetical protein